MIEFVVFGAGGHAASVADAIVSNGNQIKSFVDETGTKTNFLGYKVVVSFEAVIPDGGNVVIAIGDNFVRKKLAERLVLKGLYKFPPVVHRTAYIGLNASIGEGAVVLAHANVGANSKVGGFALLNTRSSVDHDCFLEAYSSLAPSATTGGNVRLCQASAVGIGATVSHKVTVGSNTVIGAGSLVNKDVPESVVAYGVPCRVIRHREIGSSYL